MVFDRKRNRDRTWDEAPPWAVDLKKSLSLVLATLKTQEKAMAEQARTLDETLELVSKNTDRLDSISDLIRGLRTQVTDALSGLSLPPQVQAKVNAIFAKADAQRAEIDEALNAGVDPAAPTQPADPVSTDPATGGAAGDPGTSGAVDPTTGLPIEEPNGSTGTSNDPANPDTTGEVDVSGGVTGSGTSEQAVTEKTNRRK